VRFSSTAWAYEPPAEAPLPARSGSDSELTFGCFNNFAKVSDATIRCWASVLNAMPQSRLLLKAQGLERPAQQERVKLRFEGQGIEPGRIELSGRLSGLREHLAAYSAVDIALDTFPYNGTTTTCEALWMGVPVLTLQGGHHMSRVGASLLSAVGHAEWIARTIEEYIVITRQLAADRQRLAEFRMELRTQLENSPLFDHAGQAKRFGDALRKCWTTWCERTAGAT